MSKYLTCVNAFGCDLIGGVTYLCKDIDHRHKDDYYIVYTQDNEYKGQCRKDRFVPPNSQKALKLSKYIDGNGLLMRFMGWEDQHFTFSDKLYDSQIPFHDRWKLLMPVAKKINEELPNEHRVTLSTDKKELWNNCVGLVKELKKDKCYPKSHSNICPQ